MTINKKTAFHYLTNKYYVKLNSVNNEIVISLKCLRQIYISKINRQLKQRQPQMSAMNDLCLKQLQVYAILFHANTSPENIGFVIQ